MARSEGFFRNTALNTVNALEFLDICEVSKAASGLLGENEVRFPEVVVRKSISQGATPRLN